MRRPLPEYYPTVSPYGWNPYAQSPLPGDSASVALAKALGFFLAFAVSIFILSYSLRSTLGNDPELVLIRSLIVLVTVGIADLVLIAALSKSTGSSWWRLGFKVLPIAVYKSYRNPIRPSFVGKASIAAVAIPLLVAGFAAVAGTQSGSSSGAINIALYPSYTPTPRIRVTSTPSPNVEATPTPNDALSVSDASSYDQGGMAELLSRKVAKSDTPGSMTCEAETVAMNADVSYVEQWCDWGFVAYYVYDTDAEAIEATLEGMEDYRVILDAYPQMPAIGWDDEYDYYNVVIAVGNVVVYASTGPDYMEEPHYDDVDGDIHDHALILAEHGVKRVIRLGGEPNADPGLVGSW